MYPTVGSLASPRSGLRRGASYITYFDNFKENIKNLWSGVKEIINKKSNDKINVLYLQINGNSSRPIKQLQTHSISTSQQ